MVDVKAKSTFVAVANKNKQQFERDIDSLHSLKEWYEKHPKYFNWVADVIERKTRLSLRIMNFYVSQWARNKRVFIVKDNDVETVHNHYMAAMDTYKKRCFDVFKRTVRDEITIGDRTLISTIGQLQFFKIFEISGMRKDAMQNLDRIEEAMTASIHKKKRKGKKEKSTKKVPRSKKRQRIDRKPRIICQVIEAPIKIDL